jgi:V/A-type H+-transporting ATPase subunit E
MGLDELIEDIRKDTEQKRDEILKKAREEADEILKKAREEADRILKIGEEDAKRLAESERRERISSARLQAGRIVAEAREEVVERAIARMWEFLAELKKRDEYREFLKNVIEQGRKELGGDVKVSASPEDFEIIMSLAPDAELSEFDTKGGVVLTSGKVWIDSTFESLMAENMEKIRLMIYEHVFGESR